MPSAEGYKITRRRIGDEGGEGKIPEIGTLMTYEDKPRGQKLEHPRKSKIAQEKTQFSTFLCLHLSLI